MITRSEPGRGWEYERNPQWARANSEAMPDLPGGHVGRIKMTVVKNSLARKALSTPESKLRGFEQLLDGPSALVYGQASIATIARLLLDEKKTDDKIELRGVFFDGELYTGDKGVEQVSKMPTREEAIGQLIALVLS